MQLHNKRIDLSLDRVLPVARQMDLLSFHCPIITVAGTNGKGSCITTLESIYSTAGYRVGCYTSPELTHFCERIRISQQMVQEPVLFEAFEAVDTARGEIPLSFFEFTTLAALLIFKQASLDVLLLEVGLGGRLDTVNIIDATVAVITSIGLDHTEFLGHDRYAIAREKAGIMRQGCPVISGDQNPPASISETANAVGANLLQINQDFCVECDDLNQTWGWHSPTQQYNHLPLPIVRLNNAACAIQAIECLKSRLPVTYPSIISGLRSVYLPGRFEQQSFKQVPVILDVAHNPDAVRALLDNVKGLVQLDQIRAVFTCAANKDIAGMVTSFKPYVTHWYVAPLFPDYLPGCQAAGNSSEKIVSVLDRLNCQFTCADSVEMAFKVAHNDCQFKQDQLVLVFGSFKTVAAVKRAVSFDKDDKICLL